MTDHLSEDERQALADSSLIDDADAVRHARDHVRQCAVCAADVRMLQTTLMTIRSAPRPQSAAPIEELWPAIRSRIERTKVVPMPALAGAAPTRRRQWFAAGVLTAAAITALAVALPNVRRTVNDAALGRRDTSSPLAPVADSLQSYEAEARVLLDHLEVERAMMRPEAAAMIDRDLHVIDSAIGELELAIANDPKNAALHRLLAESYRQKVNLLKRAQNAG